MRDLPKAAYRASPSSKSVLTVNRSGDVTSFHVGRTKVCGDTIIKGRQPKRMPLDRYLTKLPVAGDVLTAEEAHHWAKKIRRALKR